MGIRERSKLPSVPERAPPKEPAYRAAKGTCECSVWEGERNGYYFLQAKFQRRYIDGQGRTNFTSSFEPMHFDDLAELLKIVKFDCAEALEEAQKQGKKISIVPHNENDNG